MFYFLLDLITEHNNLANYYFSEADLYFNFMFVTEYQLIFYSHKLRFRYREAKRFISSYNDDDRLHMLVRVDNFLKLN